ncbi:MAG: hypothetical protein E7132_02555 [Rikenellaceae bacterium]|nr:hypothetical protein [Rikenellaceae bacterium]
MRINLFNIKGTRVNRLTQKIGKRLDRENPKRKLGKMIAVVFSLVLILLGAFVDSGRATEVVAALLPFVFVTMEYLRLKGRAPRRKWREVMLISGCGALIFAFFPFAMWMDKESGARIELFVGIFAVLSLLMLALLGFAAWRYKLIKREIEEEKEQLWRRYERQKRLEKLNTL